MPCGWIYERCVSVTLKISLQLVSKSNENESRLYQTIDGLFTVAATFISISKDSTVVLLTLFCLFSSYVAIYFLHIVLHNVLPYLTVIFQSLGIFVYLSTNMSLTYDIFTRTNIQALSHTRYLYKKYNFFMQIFCNNCIYCKYT